MSISTCSEEIGRSPNESTFLCPVFVLLFIPHILKHAQGAVRFISGLASLDDLPDNLSTMGNATETNSSFLKCVNFLFPTATGSDQTLTPSWWAETDLRGSVWAGSWSEAAPPPWRAGTVRSHSLAGRRPPPGVWPHRYGGWPGHWGGSHHWGGARHSGGTLRPLPQTQSLRRGNNNDNGSYEVYQDQP